MMENKNMIENYCKMENLGMPLPMPSEKLLDGIANIEYIYKLYIESNDELYLWSAYQAARDDFDRSLEAYSFWLDIDPETHRHILRYGPETKEIQPRKYRPLPKSKRYYVTSDKYSQKL